jgi:outer membrane protein OmpA-like peptidoglycan-associated protein
VTVTASKLELAEPIYFLTGKATLKEESLPLLEELAVVLADCSHVTVEIQVHTDPRGSSAWNYWLSHDRAREIQRALVARGVDESRLTYQGYGESCPIHSESPDHAARMRLLRRTELVRTDTGIAGGCPRPEPPPMPERYGDQRD